MKLALAALVVLSVPAFAAERPVTTPTRDVDVVYVATVGGKPVQQRTRTAADAAEIRIDTPSPGLYMILNRAAHTMDMISDGDKGVIQMAYDPARATAAPPESANYRRMGTDTVAGLGCTEWATTDNGGHPVAACFTDDGVMLRARTGDRVLVTAAKVAYGRLDPAIFAIPAGYQRTVAATKR
jgi:hypothetical protein